MGEIDELRRNIATREVRRLEILEFLQEKTGTAWICEQCGYSTYHDSGNECADCGEPFPLLNLLAFKLYASGSDDEAAIDAFVADNWPDRASEACASVQRERDALREMLGEAVAVIQSWADWLNCEEPEHIPDAADHEAMIILEMGTFLARYEASK